MANILAVGMPASSNSYTKLKVGKNRLRILSTVDEMATFYCWYTDKTDGTAGKKKNIVPYAGPTTPKPTPSGVKPEEVKLAWGVGVWNYDTEAVETWEITQRSIQNHLFELADSGTVMSDWSKYDLVIVKKGQGTDTRYTLITDEVKEIDSSILETYKKANIDLSALEKGKSPFAEKEGPIDYSSILDE